MIGAGIGITQVACRGQGGAAAFSPLSLFASGEEGAWYDPSDLSTLFQDEAGTTPVTADSQPVRLMLDKSGNDNHATAPSDAARPLYKTAGGLHWLEGDGVDDQIANALPLAQPYGRVSGIAAITAVNNKRWFGSNSGAALGQLFGSGSNLAINAGATITNPATIAINTPYIVSESYNGASSALAINSGVPTTGNAGANSLTSGLLMFDRNTPSFTPSNVRIYGVVMLNRLFTAGENASTEAWMAAKAGVVI